LENKLDLALELRTMKIECYSYFYIYFVIQYPVDFGFQDSIIYIFV